MIFLKCENPAIFIHIPKTGGNTIQKNLINMNRSLDDMTTTGHQDGEDRFNIRGQYTKEKHMKVSEYFKTKKLRHLKIFTCIRHPLDRLVSLYFSPHGHIKLNESSGKWEMPPDAEFDIDKFKELVNRSRTIRDFLSFKSEPSFWSPKIDCIPSTITILRTENLENDAKKHLNLEIAMSSNISPYKEQANAAKADKRVRDAVHNSKHQEDINLFYGSGKS